ARDEAMARPRVARVGGGRVAPRDDGSSAHGGTRISPPRAPRVRPRGRRGADGAVLRCIARRGKDRHMSSTGHLSPSPAGPPLSAGGRRLALTVHVVVALLGVSAALLALALSAAGSGDGSTAHAAYDLMRTLIFALSVPLALTALTSGLVLG